MLVTYKVLTQKDKWFSGKFDPANIEIALNAYSAQHWVVSTTASASFPSLMGNRDEMLVVLEREESGDKMFEYKVLTQKDKWFSGKFDPENIERAINSYAQQGWRIKSSVSANIPSFGGMREELIIILEREK